MASRLWEWQAFHDFQPAIADRGFTVISKMKTRSGDWLDLQAEPGEPIVEIGCAFSMYYAVQQGDRLKLNVETGRGGVQRVRLPDLKDLRRA
jgi:hypothetical protein